MTSTTRQIRNLLAVIFSAVGCACLLAFYMLYFYGPSGRYLVKNTLLSPELLGTLSYIDTNSKIGRSSRYVFDKIEFSYYDDSKKQWVKIPVNQESYAHFYRLISGESSLSDVSDKVIDEFSQQNPASLTLTVRTESRASWQDATKVFQEVQFANQGDYFRVGLREQGSIGKWIYYHHKLIYKETLSMLTSGSGH